MQGLAPSRAQLIGEEPRFVAVPRRPKLSVNYRAFVSHDVGLVNDYSASREDLSADLSSDSPPIRLSAGTGVICLAGGLFETLRYAAMKPIQFLKLTAFVSSIMLTANVSFAQIGSPGSPAGMDASLVQLFGDVKAFSAVCDMRMLDASQNEKLSGPMDFALLEEKIRVEVDMSKMKAKEMTPETIAMMKQSGMDRVISIVRPDKKNQTVIYPGMKACVSMPLPKKQADALDSKNSKMEKTPMGKETIDGHSCIKNKVVIKNEGSKPQEFLVWNASDLKDFPVQIQTSEDDQTVFMLFKQIQFSKPAAATFEVPSDYKKYDDMGSFMQDMMAKMMQGMTK
jgi:hypothetical protein